MKKLLSLLAISLFLGIGFAQARNSAETYDAKYYSQQEFVQAYNATTGPLYRDYVVGLYAVTDQPSTISLPGINPNTNLGQYVVEATGSTTDNIYAFGVIDDSVIPSGQLGRIAIRGPHKVVVATGSKIVSSNLSVGTLLSQCSNNVDFVSGASGPQIPITSANTTVINGGAACIYSTATGTAAATIGYILNTTATTDTGDVGVASNAQNQGTSTNNEYWAWINPQVLR